MIPYGRQTIEEDDIDAVVQTLRSDWLTTGPKVGQFEEAVAQYVGTRHGIAVNSGTAALHAMIAALEIGPGDEVIVPSLTFAATANCVVYQGATPVFADVDPETLLLCPDSVARLISQQTRAIIAVDYAGQPCDYARLNALASQHGIPLLTDGCHALGAEYHGRKVGQLSAMTAFSFHPVKAITTGEGGMVTTDDSALAERMKRFRNHGIVTDARQREKAGTWFYEMQSLGFNYRICDIQCALGIQQLKKLDGWIERRQQVASLYESAFADDPNIRTLKTLPETRHAHHLCVIRVLDGARSDVFQRLRDSGIGVNVHYVPVHLHPFYRQRFGTGPGLCPNAELAYEQILSLPVYPGVTNDQVKTVIAMARTATRQSRKAA